jgi:hypothetical protein
MPEVIDFAHCEAVWKGPTDFRLVGVEARLVAREQVAYRQVST